MRKLLAAAAVFGLIVVVSTQTTAQPGLGGLFGRGGGADRTTLIVNKSVQEEIKLTDEQKTGLAEKSKEVREKSTELFKEMFKGGFKKLEKEEQEKLQAKMKEIAEPFNKYIDTTLKDDQKKRLKEIVYQQMGTGAFANEEVVKELKITDEQKEKVAAISTESQKEIRSLTTELFKGGDREEITKKISNLRREATEKALKVLDADQKKQWETMTGKPFEVKNEAPMFKKKTDNE